MSMNIIAIWDTHKIKQLIRTRTDCSITIRVFAIVAHSAWVKLLEVQKWNKNNTGGSGNPK